MLKNENNTTVSPVTTEGANYYAGVQINLVLHILISDVCIESTWPWGDFAEVGRRNFILHFIKK